MEGNPSIENSKRTICSYFIKTAQQCSPQDALALFRQVFIEFTEHDSSIKLSWSVAQLLLSNSEEEFQYTLKRVCYILIHEWWTQKQKKFIGQLIQQFEDPLLLRPSISKEMNRLRSWIGHFKASQDFQDLQLYMPVSRTSQSWQDRYRAYLLSHHYLKDQTPLEQRLLAKLIAYDDKMAFRYELVTFKSHHRFNKSGSLAPKNPSNLNKTALFIIIKKVLIHRKHNLPQNLKSTFEQKLKNKTFLSFKKVLNKFLIRSLKSSTVATLFENTPMATLFKVEASSKLLSLYENQNEDLIHEDLITQSCQRIVEMLTTENYQTPTRLFSMFLWGNSALELVLLLQIIAFLSPDTKNHIDFCIAHLIHACEGLENKEKQAMMNFLEIFRVVFSIYGDYDHYSIITLGQTASSTSPEASGLDSYRVLSHWKNKHIKNKPVGNQMSPVQDGTVKVATV